MPFEILKELENGELHRVATREDREEAELLVQQLKEHWPGTYLIRDWADAEKE